MAKIRFIAIILSILLMAACAPSQEAIQKAISETQAAIPTATLTSTPNPTATLHSPTFAAILGTNGFVLNPSYEASCTSPCTSYEVMKPWMTAKIFDNGGFEVFGSKDDTQILFTIITQLYEQDMTDWIAGQLPILLHDPNASSSTDKKICQDGSAGSFDIKLCMMDFGNRLWITITPK